MTSTGKTTQNLRDDPWAVLPPQVKQNIIAASGASADAVAQAVREADRLGKDPRDILGMGQNERAALDQVLSTTAEAEGLGDQAAAGLMDEYGTEFGRGGFEDIYTEDVVDAGLADMQRQAQRDQLERDARAAAVGGTTNTRAAVADAVAQGETSRAMADFAANQRRAGLEWGTNAEFQLSDLDQQDRRLELERLGMMDQFATSDMNRGLASADWQKEYGAEERALSQEELDERRTAKQQSITWLTQMLGQGTNKNATLGGGTTTGTTSTTGTERGTNVAPGERRPSTASSLLGAASSVAGIVGMLSDENAKENFELAESGLDDLRHVRSSDYDYKEGMPTDKVGRQRGLIAQDLEHIPGAVSMGPDGYRRVEPYAVLATVVSAVRALDDRTRPGQAGLE